MHYHNQVLRFACSRLSRATERAAQVKGDKSDDAAKPVVRTFYDHTAVRRAAITRLPTNR